MTRWLAMILMAGVLACAPHVRRDADRRTAFLEDVAHATAVYSDRPALAHPLFGPLLEDSRFHHMAAPTRRQLLNTAAHAAEAAADFAAAHERLARLVDEHPEADIELLWLSYYELGSGDAVAAATWLERFVDQAPSLAWQVDPQRVAQLAQASGELSDPLYRALERMRHLGWHPSRPGTDGIWLALACGAIARGDPDVAHGAIARIDEPYGIVLLRIDRRFDAFFDRNAPRFDPKRAARAQARMLYRDSILAPQSNDVAGNLLGSLLAIGEHDKVERLTRPGGRFGSAPDPAGTDHGWIANARADALLRLGRTAESLKLMKAASRSSEGDATNVSQTLNLADAACRLGNAEYASYATAQVGHMSGYGRMVLAGIGLCAAQAEGDAALVDALLERMQDGRHDAPGIYLDRLLRVGQSDAAADAVVAMLKAPRTRPATLMWLQDFIELPAKGTSFRTARERSRLLARADVMRAVDAVGRRERNGLYRP